MARYADSPAQHSPPTTARALDVGRGLAIVLVMYGHALAPWVMDTHGWFSFEAFIQWKLGASFLMPFFFVMSGLSWREEKTLKAALREALTLILTAWMVSVVVDLVRLALTFGGLSQVFLQAPLTMVQVLKNSARMLVYGDFYSVSALWFLGALALTRLLAACALRIGAVFTCGLAVVLIVAGLAAQMTALRNYQQIYLLGVAFSSFVAGHAARDAFATLLERPWRALLATALGAAIVFPTFGLNQGCTFDIARRCGIPTLNNEFGVAMIYGAYGNLALFAITTVAGIVFGVGVSVLVARYGGFVAARLNSLGRSTLNLLIINALTLEFINPQVQLWLAPHISGHGFVFFTVVFVLSVTVTTGGYALLRKPLRFLRSRARFVAHWLVDLPAVLRTGWSARPLRVSAAHELSAGPAQPRSAERRALRGASAPPAGADLL